MILWGFGIILVVIAIVVLLVLFWYNRPQRNPIPPTMHSRCGINSKGECGGDLTCDPTCHRCKKKLGSDCAVDVDCETGLYCINWICSRPLPDSTFTPDRVEFTADHSHTRKKSTVRWEL